jgi:hypothetical protein
MVMVKRCGNTNATCTTRQEIATINIQQITSDLPTLSANKTTTQQKQSQTTNIQDNKNHKFNIKTPQKTPQK